MRRRSVIGALLVGFAGCATRPSDEASSTRPATDASTEKPPTEVTDVDCVPVSTEFDVPPVERPETLTDADAVDVAYRIEREYQDTLGLSPAAFPGVPDGTGPYDYALADESAETYTADGTVSVTVTAIVSYTVSTTDEDGTVSETSYDRPVDVAVYDVSKAAVARHSGVGELTGTLLCW